MNKIYLSIIALFTVITANAQINYGFDYPQAYESFSSRDTAASIYISLFNAKQDSTIRPYSAILSVDDNSSTAKNGINFSITPAQQKVEFAPGQMGYRNVIRFRLNLVPDTIFWGTKSFKLNLTTLEGFTASDLIHGFSEMLIVIDYDGRQIGIPRVSKDNYNLYPNPAKDIITITGVECQNTAIFDLMGKMVLNPVVANNQINIESLPAGIYTLKVVTDKGLLVHKIVKE